MHINKSGFLIIQENELAATPSISKLIHSYIYCPQDRKIIASGDFDGFTVRGEKIKDEREQNHE